MPQCACWVSATPGDLQPRWLPVLAQAAGEEGALLDLAVAAVEMLATVANASADGKAGAGSRCAHMI